MCVRVGGGGGQSPSHSPVSLYVGVTTFRMLCAFSSTRGRHLTSPVSSRSSPFRESMYCICKKSTTGHQLTSHQRGHNKINTTIRNENTIPTADYPTFLNKSTLRALVLEALPSILFWCLYEQVKQQTASAEGRMQERRRFSQQFQTLQHTTERMHTRAEGQCDVVTLS